MVIEPVVAWIGYDPASYESVHRAVRLVPYVEPFTLVCFVSGVPRLAVKFVPELSERCAQALARAAAGYLGTVEGPTYVGVTDGELWHVYEMREDGGLSAIHASLARPALLWGLGPPRAPGNVQPLPSSAPVRSVPLEAATHGPSPLGPAAPARDSAPPAKVAGTKGAMAAVMSPSAGSGDISSTSKGASALHPQTPFTGPKATTAAANAPLPKVESRAQTDSGHEKSGARQGKSSTKAHQTNAPENTSGGLRLAPAEPKYSSYRYVRAEETFTRPYSVVICGKKHFPDTWCKAVAIAAKEHLRRKSVLPPFVFERQEFPYFSQQPRELRRPYNLGSGWWCEANLSAAQAFKVVVEVLRTAGLKNKEFDVFVESR